MAACLLLLINISFGQELHLEEIPFAFYSKARQRFVIIEGDRVFQSKGVGDVWQESTLKLPVGVDSHFLRGRYFPMNTTKSDYFVLDGSGLVWEWRGDSLIRIDHSFEHKNQFAACPFVYHDTLFLTGGYGFFQSKNITTYFDSRAGSWFLKRTKGPIPPDRFVSYYFQGRDEVLFWGGLVRNSLGDDTLKTLWSLNMQTGLWADRGSVNPEIGLPYLRGAYYNSGEENWVHMGGRLLQFFPDSNKVQEYYSDRFYQVRGWIPHEESIMILEWRHDQSGVYALLLNKGEYLGIPCKTYSLIASPRISNFWNVFLPIGLYIFLFFYLIFYFLILKRRPVLIQKSQDHEVRISWTEIELNILEKFWKSPEGIEVSELNDLFNYGDPNFDTLKKRRELKLKELRTKLAHNTGIEESKIFIDERLSSDRRVKKLILTSQIKRENLGIPSI